MDKKKAVVCTILYVIVIVAVLTISFFVRNEEYGISLYQLIMCIVANTCIGSSVEKFYNWLTK